MAVLGTILGYASQDLSDPSSLGPGRLYASKYTLAQATTLNELHGWFQAPTAGAVATVRVVMYADSAGVPGARVAYTGIFTLPVIPSGDRNVHFSETGFSVSLSPGDYWLGFSCISKDLACNAHAGLNAGIHQGRQAGAPDPPPDPFGTPDTSGTRKHSMWAVVSSGVGTTGNYETGGQSALAQALGWVYPSHGWYPPDQYFAGGRYLSPVADFVGVPTSGPYALSVAFTDLSNVGAP